MLHLIEKTTIPDPGSYCRLPGAFRRAEIAGAVPAEAEIVLTLAGRAQDGERLFTVHIQKERTDGGAT